MTIFDLQGINSMLFQSILITLQVLVLALIVRGIFSILTGSFKDTRTDEEKQAQQARIEALIAEYIATRSTRNERTNSTNDPQSQ